MVHTKRFKFHQGVQLFNKGGFNSTESHEPSRDISQANLVIHRDHMGATHLDGDQVLTNWDILPVSELRRSYSPLLLKNNQSKAGIATLRNESIMKFQKVAPKKKKKKRNKSVIHDF